MEVENISAIMLAAGLSRRMGEGDKLLLDYRGRSLLSHAATLLSGLPCREKIMVIRPQLENIVLPKGICVVVNRNPHAGQSESLRLGLAAATGQWYLFLNADQPRLSPRALAPLFELVSVNPDKIVFPEINGNPSTPVLFPATFRELLLSQSGDAGGRGVRADNPLDCIVFKPENPRDFTDIDSAQDYRELIAEET